MLVGMAPANFELIFEPTGPSATIVAFTFGGVSTEFGPNGPAM